MSALRQAVLFDWWNGFDRKRSFVRYTWCRTDHERRWGQFPPTACPSSRKRRSAGIGEAEIFTTATTARAGPARWGWIEKGH